ncbi:MAG TPA: leucyl aminopeptidase [Ilumatobacteraceae bacterium]|nr:leucyl aminopeptidase [Ilumatobacteraceae bacterium]
MTVNVQIARATPRTAETIGVPVAASGAVPRSLGLNRNSLAAHGFDGKPGQTLVVPSAAGPTHIAVGIGDGRPSASTLRNAAAAMVRAAGKRTTIATSLADIEGIDAATAAQAVVEGALLAAYRYDGLKSEPAPSGLQNLTLVVGERRAAGAKLGVDRGSATAAAAGLARDLANTPPAHLTARMIADRAVEIAAASGLGIEVFNKDQLAAMGCGGMIGVNKGSMEPPRVVRLTYAPRNPRGHLVLVGKGVMYDSGGISLKPSDGMHAMMKMDMSGAAAVLAAMSTLKALRCRSAVTGYLMCTDNMPSGSALKLGDVLTFRNGKTAEIHNTDAEGRLVLADGLSLGVEAKPDAIVDIATLTGSIISALGQKMAGVFSNNQPFGDQVTAAATGTDEPLWQMPLEPKYRKLLDSNVADMKNVGGPYGGAILAALFLSEFVGDTPWAHLDIAGPMNSDADDGWLSRGATGFGTRLLIQLALDFTP